MVFHGVSLFGACAIFGTAGWGGGVCGVSVVNRRGNLDMYIFISLYGVCVCAVCFGSWVVGAGLTFPD